MRNIVVCLGLLLGSFRATDAASPARPNILRIPSEDYGQQMGRYGDPIARTPNADALWPKYWRFICNDCSLVADSR